MRRTVAVSLAVALSLLLSSAASGGTISGTFQTVGDEDFNLTNLGQSDWAYWDTGDSPATGGPKTNEKLGGALVSNISPVNGGNPRGSTSTTQVALDFDFTDGTSPTSGTVDSPTGLFNSQLNTVDAGVSVDVTLPTTDPHTVYLWVGAFEATGELTASLPGAVSYVDASLSGTGGAKNGGLYTLTVTPDNPNDVLNLSYVTDVSSGGNGHVLIAGSAVSPVPEPASLVLLALGVAGVGLFVCRRKLRRE